MSGAKHITLGLYCSPNALVCLFFQRGIALRDAVTSSSSSSAVKTLTSLTVHVRYSSLPKLRLFLTHWRRQRGREKKYIFNENNNNKKNKTKISVWAACPTRIFFRFDVPTKHFSFDVFRSTSCESTFILEWLPCCCRYRLCVRSSVSNFLPESSSLKCKLAASENEFFFLKLKALNGLKGS